MQTIDCSTVIDVPPEVAVCPYCDGKLAARPESWTQEDDGTWSANHSGIECCNQPELDEDRDGGTDDWDEWLASHSVMPYVHWLPVDNLVVDWLKANYRFNCD